MSDQSGRSGFIQISHKFFLYLLYCHLQVRLLLLPSFLFVSFLFKVFVLSYEYDFCAVFSRQMYFLSFIIDKFLELFNVPVSSIDIKKTFFFFFFFFCF